jgi:hypothetical protein
MTDLLGELLIVAVAALVGGWYLARRRPRNPEE